MLNPVHAKKSLTKRKEQLTGQLSLFVPFFFFEFSPGGLIPT
jgi:hypothetical protein